MRNNNVKTLSVAGLLTTTLLSGQAQAAIALDRTRVILNGGPMSTAKNAGVVISHGADTVKLGTPINIGVLKAGADTEYTLNFTSHLRGNGDDKNKPIQAGTFFSTANFIVNYN